MPIIIRDVEQGSREWEELRLGIPTASEAKRIVTPTGKASSAQNAYLADLAAEWALGEPTSDFGGTEWMNRGKDLEPQARKHYGFIRDIDPEPVGFIYRDEKRLVGCSPDALIGEEATLELKCPKAGKHLFWLAQDILPKEYVVQVQFQMWVTGFEYADFMSFYPGLPQFIIKTAPDPKLQDAFDEHVPPFIERVLAMRERLVELGVIPWFEQVEEQEQQEGDPWLTDEDIEFAGKHAEQRLADEDERRDG